MVAQGTCARSTGWASAQRHGQGLTLSCDISDIARMPWVHLGTSNGTRDLRGQPDFYLVLILLYKQGALQRRINSMTCLTNYEIKTWICPVYIIGQKWN